MVYLSLNQIIKKENTVGKIMSKLTSIIVFGLCVGVANAESLKPTVTVLHAGTKSATGLKLSYPQNGNAKMILAQAIFPAGAVLPMHTHPSPLLVHLIAGELTSVRPNGDAVTYKAGDSYIEAPNSPHKVTNTGRRPAILYGVFATVEGHGPLTVFGK